MKTMNELADKVLPEGTSYDTALPQPWVDDMQALRADPRGHYVWLYDKVNPIFGRPFCIHDQYPDQARLNHDSHQG